MENTKNQTKNKSPGQPSREQDEVVVHREIITRGESVFSANTLWIRNNIVGNGSGNDTTSASQSPPVSAV